MGERIGSRGGDWASRWVAPSGSRPLIGEVAPADPADLADLVEYLRVAGPVRMLHLAVRIPAGTHPMAISALLEHAGPAARAIVSLRSDGPIPARWRHAGASLIVDVVDERTGASPPPRALSQILAALPQARWELNLPRDEANAQALLGAHAQRLGQLSLALCDADVDLAGAGPSSVRADDAGRHRRALAGCGHVPWILTRPEPAHMRTDPR